MVVKLQDRRGFENHFSRIYRLVFRVRFDIRYKRLVNSKEFCFYNLLGGGTSQQGKEENALGNGSSVGRKGNCRRNGLKNISKIHTSLICRNGQKPPSSNSGFEKQIFHHGRHGSVHYWGNWFEPVILILVCQRLMPYGEKQVCFAVLFHG